MLVLSNTPPAILKSWLTRRPVKSWIYLGNQYDAQIFQDVLGNARRIDYAAELYSISREKRSEFIDWIDRVGEHMPKAKEWFLSVPAVKNPYNSQLFLQVCFFYVMDALHKQGRSVDLVIVDSPALAGSLRRYVKPYSYHSGYFIFNLLWQLRSIAKSKFRYMKYGFDLVKRFILARRILRFHGKKLLRDVPNIVFIRNYISGDYRDEAPGIVENHYFPGLYDYLKKEGGNPVFLPFAVRVSDYRALYEAVKAGKRNIVFAEEFLTTSDYVYTLCSYMRALVCWPSRQLLGPYDLMGLVREEFFANLSESGYLNGLLLSRLGRRFKQCRVACKGVINWAEFQAIDKGLIVGLRQYFPNMTVVGAQPFLIPPNHHSMLPSRQDRLIKTLPDRILALGPMGKKMIEEFHPQLPVQFSPAFRYESILQGWRPGTRKNALVLFGYGLPNALRTLRILAKLATPLASYDKIWIKLHPAGYFDQRRLLECHQKPLPANFEFVDGPLERYFPDAALGICGATGSAVELVWRGTPVIQIGEADALTMNYLAAKEDPRIWQLCFNQREVAAALYHFRPDAQDWNELRKIGEEFQRAYIAPPDRRYWEHYKM